MRISKPLFVTIILSSVASGIALTHMNNVPAFVVIGPGYLVQAWLFEHHLALGGSATKPRWSAFRPWCGH